MFDMQREKRLGKILVNYCLIPSVIILEQPRFGQTISESSQPNKACKPL